MVPKAPFSKNVIKDTISLIHGYIQILNLNLQHPCTGDEFGSELVLHLFISSLPRSVSKF